MPDEDTAEGKNLPLIYVNWFRTVPTAYDLGIDVGYRHYALEPQPAARLVMSWEYAVVVRDLLSKMIQTYEEETGESIRQEDLELGEAKFVPEQ
jgi:hypothetical protein